MHSQRYLPLLHLGSMGTPTPKTIVIHPHSPRGFASNISHMSFKTIGDVARRAGESIGSVSMNHALPATTGRHQLFLVVFIVPVNSTFANKSCLHLIYSPTLTKVFRDRQSSRSSKLDSSACMYSVCIAVRFQAVSSFFLIFLKRRRHPS